MDGQRDDAIPVENLSLRFTSATCENCSDTVAYAESCSCGAWTGEPDPLVESRRSLLRTVVDLIPTLTEGLAGHVSSGDGAEQPLERFSNGIDVLSPWISEFFDYLRGTIASGEPFVSDLETHVRRLVALQGVLAPRPPRPWIALWHPMQDVVANVGLMATSFVEAAVASTRSAALDAETRGQAALDAAAGSIGLVVFRVAIWRQEGTVRAPDSLLRAASRAYQLTGAKDVLDLDQRSAKIYSRISGRPPSAHGIGVSTAVATAHVADAFDENRYWLEARSAFQVLTRDPDKLRSLTGIEGWDEPLRAARLDLFDGLIQTEILLSGLREGEERMEVDAVLQLGARVIESVARRFMALLMAIEHPSRAAGLLRRKTAVVLRQARQAGFTHLMYGFDDVIRNAAAHRDYRLTADRIEFTPGTGEYASLTYAELVDRVLGALESASLLCVAFDCAAADVGLPLTEALPDLSIRDRIALLLGLAGIFEADLDVRGDRLVVEGRAGTGITVKPMALAAFLVPGLPGEIAGMELTLQYGEDTTITASGPLAPFRAEAEQESEREATLLETLATWTVNGRPVASRAFVRRWASIVAAKTIGEPLASATERLRPVIALARRLRDEDLESSLEAQLAIAAATEADRPVPRHVKRRQLRIASWLRSPASILNDGSDQVADLTIPPGMTPA